jgi:hypothetical protein
MQCWGPALQRNTAVVKRFVVDMMSDADSNVRSTAR